MTVTWMLYATALAALVGAAAACLDAALRAARRPTRLVWAAALVGSLALPAAMLAVARTRAAASAAGASAVAPEARRFDASALDALLARARVREDVDAPSPWHALDRPLLAAWLVASLVGLGRLAISGHRLRTASRTWHATTLHGNAVLVSPNTGPAAVAVDGGRVVLPAWALAAGDDALALMLAHERAHVAARDPQLLAAAVAAVALAPWNPALWWQLDRLRVAAEIDCDRRVLRRHPDVRAYGALLLDVARRGAAHPTLAAALSAPSPTTALERRIRTMTSRPPRHALVRSLALGALGICLTIAACEAPHPTAPRPEARVPLASITSAAPSVASVDGPPTVETLRAILGKRVKDLAAGHVSRIWVVRDATGRPLTVDLGGADGDAALSLHGASIRLGERQVKVGPSPLMNTSAKSGSTPLASTIDPKTIQSVDVVKLAPGRLTPDAVDVIWVTLRTPGVAAAPEEKWSPAPGLAASTTDAEPRFHVTVNDKGQPTSIRVGPIDSAHAMAGGPAHWSTFRTRSGVEGEAHVVTRSPLMLRGDTAPAAPLLYVDGREVTTSPLGEPMAKRLEAAGVTADRIASVEVLKGRAAVERYGAQGVNGVVIVTTKHER